ncbi:MAG TPA: RcnB family protein [Rhizomicrobium sp.]|nr:RcnB family protein [Rhizomicrobium sp.]
MKKLLLGATALAALLAAPIAMADPNDNGPKDRPDQHDTAKPDRGDNNNMKGPDRNGPNDNAMRGPKAGQDNGPRGGNNDNDRARDNNNDRDNDKTVNKTVVHKSVDRSVVLKVRANIKAPRRFHPAKAYVRPAGWYAHKWVYGDRLPRAFFAPDYFILDFATYGLIAPWDGYEWVRYGDDALLVDIDTGEVIRVEYDLFD